MSIACAELEPAVQSERFASRSSATSTTTPHCLVVAEDDARRAFLTASAERVGWQVTAFADSHSASAAAHRFRHSLAIVDLDGLQPDQSSSYRTLTEQLSQTEPPLLMICGSDGNPLEELWARQLGVWLYLAGVDPTCDLTSLCGEAKQIVEKLSARQPAYARTA